MKAIAKFAAAALLAAMLSVSAGSAAAEAGDEATSRIARGVVFEDADGDGERDNSERGIEGVGVSNGRDIVATDAEGRYELAVDDDAIVFVIKPSGWRTPIDRHMLPRFYYVHKPAGSPELEHGGVPPTGPLPESIDFPLQRQDEPRRFEVILFGDTQPRNLREVDYIAHDVVEELIGTEAAFGVTLGDIVFDDLSVMEPLNRAIALIGVPWYNVIGNHDINRDAPDDRLSDETFERIYGPSYYAFDYGPVHYIVIDDVEWVVEEGRRSHYRAALGERQLRFTANDLSRTPREKLVVLLMHIPLVDSTPWVEPERQRLLRLLEERPYALSIAGHEHHHAHHLLGREQGWRGAEPHHHIVNVTVCGAWWRGAPDEYGVPHAMMGDGVPNGYSVMTFDGRGYSLRYKAAGRPADYQMHIDAPQVVAADRAGETDVWANVFNAMPNARVRMRLGSDERWIEMKRTVEPDPVFLRAVQWEKGIADHPWLELSQPKGSTHLWRAKLPAGLGVGAHLIRVRAEDPDGRVFLGRRIIRIAEPQGVGGE